MANRLLITGANRGLGLEFAKQYATDGWEVIATCRNPVEAKALQSLKTHFTNTVTISIHPLLTKDK